MSDIGGAVSDERNCVHGIGGDACLVCVEGTDVWGWRARALAAEQERDEARKRLGYDKRDLLRRFAEVERDSHTHLAERDTLRKALADRDQQLAELRSQIVALRSCVVPTALTCPECSAAHVDEGDWSTRPHRTHQCQHCFHEWRPYEVSTRGVPQTSMDTFAQAWARTGYQYGGDALENVRLGWELARGTWKDWDPPLDPADLLKDEPTRAAIEAEVVEQVAAWLERVLADAKPMSPIGYNAGAIDMANRVIRDLRSGAWRKP